jgi:hypothetical protein
LARNQESIMDIAARMNLSRFVHGERGETSRALAASADRRDGCTDSDATGAFVMTLARSRVVPLGTRVPVEIRCLSGQLWITQDGKIDDVVLQAGQSHKVAGPERDILISAVGEGQSATVEFLPAGPMAGRPGRALQRRHVHFRLELA